MYWSVKDILLLTVRPSVKSPINWLLKMVNWLSENCKPEPPGE